MGDPLIKVVDARFVVAADYPTESFLKDAAEHLHVHGVTELKADGFGHLTPGGFAEVFLDEPQAAEVQRALETGEVQQ